MNPNQCDQEIWRGYHPERCTRAGKVERDGKWYCLQHDPVRHAEQQAKRDEEARRTLAAENARRDYARLSETACMAAGVTLDDLRNGRVRVTVISHDMEQQP